MTKLSRSFFEKIAGPGVVEEFDRDCTLAVIKQQLSYLEEAEAHAQEGPLGEPAARAILQIALNNTRELQKRISGPKMDALP